MKYIILFLIIFFSENSLSGEININGVGLTQDIKKIRDNSILMTTPGSEHNILEYCNEQDKEKKDFFSYKSKFFKGFESRRYDSQQYSSNNLGISNNIEGYKINNILYDVYNDKIAKIDISLDTYTTSSFKASDQLSKFFTNKIGKPVKDNTWRKGAGDLTFKYDIIGTTHIIVANPKLNSEINAFTEKSCSTVSAEAQAEYQKIQEIKKAEERKELDRAIEHRRAVEESWEPKNVERNIQNMCSNGMLNCK